MIRKTRMYVVVGAYRTGGLAGKTCSASFYSKAARYDLLLADAQAQNRWMRPIRVSEVIGNYGGTSVDTLVAAHDATQARTALAA